jgi:hypothetical protein
MTAQGPEQPFQPSLTVKGIIRKGFSKYEAREAIHSAHRIVQEHQQRETPREKWEPQATYGEDIAAPFIKAGEEELARQLASKIDTLLGDAGEYNTLGRQKLDELTSKQKPLVAPDSGVRYGVAEAVDRVDELDAKIEEAELAGDPHHRRAPHWLKPAGLLVLWLEFVGCLYFVTYYLNVPLWEPLLDFGAWSLSFAIVFSTILGQTLLVHHGAKEHNHGREAYAEGNEQEGEDAFHRRNCYLGLSVLTATAVIAGGMVLRGMTALAGTDPATKVFMVFVAVAAAAIMPTLLFLGVALDGSRISRERDSLARQLNRDLEVYNQTIEECVQCLERVSNDSDAFTEIIPEICDEVQTVVDHAYRPYNLLRLLIGGLAADPPVKTSPAISWNDDGTFYGRIGTSIPGAGDVDLRHLADRYKDLEEIEKKQCKLSAELSALPPHPWGTDRTAVRRTTAKPSVSHSPA